MIFSTRKKALFLIKYRLGVTIHEIEMKTSKWGLFSYNCTRRTLLEGEEILFYE